MGRCLNAAIVRSPESHGVLERIDAEDARAAQGVVAVFTASDIARVCRPWRAEHALYVGARVPEETPLACDRVRYVGEPVAIIIAEEAGLAVGAVERVGLSIRPLPPVVDPVAALEPAAEPLHPELIGDGRANLHHAFGASLQPPHPDEILLTLNLARVAPQPLETRAILADFDPADRTLTVTQSHQHPHMMQDVYARLLGIPEHRVRVVCKDVGGAFGVKQQLHPDEMAVVCAAVLLGQRVRFVATRSESLLADAQARDHRLHIAGRIDPDSQRVVALSFDDLCGVGAFGHFPRTSFGEAGLAARLVGAPYAIGDVRCHARLAFQNRPHLGHYRGVGHPVACLATEAMLDEAARHAGEGPIAYRRRHLPDPQDGRFTTASGIAVKRYRMAECLNALEAGLSAMPRGRRGNMLDGVGVACLVELIAGGSPYYGDGGVNISSDETAVIRMEPSGVVRVATANTDQGQGADQAAAQIVADVLTIGPHDVTVVSGDSAHTPYGGGAFGSRQTTLGGAAAHDAALRLRETLIASAALLLQRQRESLTLSDGNVCDSDGSPLLEIAELARTSHFKPHLFPAGHDAGLVAIGRHTPPADGMVSCAAFGAAVSVDRQTGAVDVRRIIIAHDGGTLINPANVRAQLEGGAAQGLGQALMEAVRVDAAGQPLTGSFMDYAMPRADDVAKVEVVHLPPREEDSAFAPRGVGEAGASGVPAAIFNAVNDALAVEGAKVSELPMTAEVVWRALQSAKGSEPPASVG